MDILRTLLLILAIGVLACVGGPASAQPWPPSSIPEPEPDMVPWGPRDRDAYRERDEYAERRASGAAAQLWLLEQALDRYREIERRGGWKKVPTDLSMGPPYSYDCRRIEMLEDRLLAEGYLRRRSTPPPPPPVPMPPAGNPPRPVAPPPPPEPLGQGGPCEYGRTLADAVRAFQKDRKVLGDGQVGALTFAELNRPVGEIVDILEQDVERWRDVSLDPSGTYLLVNIPFFELIAYERGREALRMPVIVGLPTWQTPLFSDELEHIIVNPDWGIPDTIAKSEIWPLQKRDPNYFKREGITGGEGGLRQKPGPRNPLGRIKFMMPNKYNVYLHDTPHKKAFNAAVRALSHGCIRLSQPIELATYLLRDSEWSPRRLQAAISSGRTQRINLPQHMPVHIIYSTSRVNEDGRVELRPDVYRKNRRSHRPPPPVERMGEEIDVGP
ncbi:MAG TPA: L,D-transpeptidase family protein [Candidatus Limnocylindrales bacterium]|nr:L,D-transpeptidase family protein [Candidatus Limnocylindrales bacterium]